MVYKIAELSEDEVFEVEFKGVTYRLPLLENISLDSLEHLSSVADDPSKVTIENIRDVMRALDPDFASIVGQLSASRLMGVFTALSEASSVSLGESTPSVENSNGTEEPSKPIFSTEG